MRTYDVLILGIETKIGQKAYSLLEQDYGYLSVAVPLSEYSRKIRYPQNQVKIDYSNEKNINSVVSSFKIIVAFNQKKIYNKIISEAKDKFVDASKFSLQMVIELFKEEVPILSSYTDIQLNIKASFRYIFHFIFYPKNDYMPVCRENGYSITIEKLDIGKLENGKLNESTKIDFNLFFATCFFSLVFFILSILFKPIILLLQFFVIFKLPFNEHSIKEGSCSIRWKDKNANKKNQKDDSIYYIDPNQDENEVICDYIRLKLNYILKLTNQAKKIKFRSINCYTEAQKIKSNEERKKKKSR